MFGAMASGWSYRGRMTTETEQAAERPLADWGDRGAMVDPDDMIAGQRYDVRLDHGCIEGTLTGVFIAPEGDDGGMRFDFGVIRDVVGDYCGQVTFHVPMRPFPPGEPDPLARQ